MCFFFFKQKTAYEMRISDWSSDVCSSDLLRLSHFRRRKRCGVGSQCNPPCPAHARRTDTADTAQSGSDQAVRPCYPECHRLDGRCSAGRLCRLCPTEIGRASCRERVCQYGEISVVAVSLKKKKKKKQ